MAPARERDLAAGTMSNRFRGYYTPNDTQCPARGGLIGRYAPAGAA